MRSFIRVNGTEISVEDSRIVDGKFNEVMISELKEIFGQNSQFELHPQKVFGKEEHSQNIFSGIITGQFESECPIAIHVYIDLPLDIQSLDEKDIPECDLIIPAFIGFRK